MEHINFKILYRTSIILSVSFLVFKAFAIETKRFDAPPQSRGEYLAFSKPMNLRYGISPPKVNRMKLIMPPTISSVTTTVNTESNATSKVQSNDFPLVPLQEDNSSLSSEMPPALPNLPDIAPPETLPLSDPFEDMNSFGIDSTDELLEVFESSNMNTPRSSMQNIPFVPPYTVAPDNMRVMNKATYQRRQR